MFRPIRPPVTQRLALLVIGSLLSACSTLHKPANDASWPIPETWSSPQTNATTPGVSAHSLHWRDYFTDPLLNHLIATALDNNRDLRIAILRVDEARIAFNIQRADRVPNVQVGAQMARARVPADLNASGQAVIAGEYRAEVGISHWELDLWGRVRHLNEAALNRWLDTTAGRRATELALIAQVADGYLALRELDERASLARHTVQSREESLRIFRRRHEVGSASKLELMQVQTLLSQAQSLHVQLEQAYAIQRHALGQLIGTALGPLPAAAAFDETMALTAIDPGLPSEQLQHRPDLIAAEYRLRAARADVAAARAAFFPRIALTATLGSASTELNGLFDAGSGAWTFAPTLSLPIFDGGRRQAQLDLSQVREHIAIADYERTIQAAFRDVADALAARQGMNRQLEIQRIAVDAQRERARLAKLRYDNGSATYLEVLDAQRDLLASEQQRVQVRRALLSSQVALYAALGGGSTSQTASSDAATHLTP